MTQPYSKLQETFKTAYAVPKIPARRIRILPLKRRRSAAASVMRLAQAARAESVHLVVGNDLGDVDLILGSPHPKMMDHADGIFPDGYQSIQQGFSILDFPYSFMFPQPCLKLLGLLVCGLMTNIGPCNQTVGILHKKETPCYRCLLFLFRIIKSSLTYCFSFKKSRFKTRSCRRKSSPSWMRSVVLGAMG